MRWPAPLALLVCIPGLLEAQQPTAAVEAEVLDAVHTFHDALAASDSAAALRLLHPEVVIYEGGHAETLDEYRGGHLPADMAFASGTQHERTFESVRSWGEQALYTSESHTTGRWRDRDIDARGTETMVLVRTPDGWRILHIHWSSR